MAKRSAGTRLERCSPSGSISVAEVIHRRFDQLTVAECKVARVLLANYPMAGLESLTIFAQQAGVSHPTVLRFIAKLDLAAYADFQVALRSELEARLKSPLAKRSTSEIEPSIDADFLSRYADAVCDNIRQSVASVPRTAFNSVLELLADTRNKVYLIGGRFTDPVATYAYMHMRVLRPRVHHMTGPAISWSEYVLDMDSRTVLLIFDIRRYQENMICLADEALKRGCHIILITDNWLSPVASRAEHVLTARIEVPSSWDSVVAISTLLEALIAALNDRRWPELEGRLNELERMRSGFEAADQ